MTSVLRLLFVLVLLVGCDDGDIIVTTFDFDDQQLELCPNSPANQYLFFKINNSNNETLALALNTSTPFLTTAGANEINLGSSSNSLLTYRRFDEAISASYFCDPLPPTDVTVVEEFTSQEGDVVVTTLFDENDNDGIPSALERIEVDGNVLDTDGDGIPDYFDFDDDGDNVPTNLEGVVLNEDGTIDVENSLDTDGDGILNYLDPDDDGDGVLTRNEDANQDLNPTNDTTDPEVGDDYLNPAVAVDYSVDGFRIHTYTLTERSLFLTVSNLSFLNADTESEINDISTLVLGEINLSDATITVTPNFVSE
ncbi:hypothetical protein [Croceiramulus getboli]|nr:hypothetical protein P8624_12575 [Flavobacteriaceae bacterium YJPT1-3]